MSLTLRQVMFPKNYEGFVESQAHHYYDMNVNIVFVNGQGACVTNTKSF